MPIRTLEHDDKRRCREQLGVHQNDTNFDDENRQRLCRGGRRNNIGMSPCPHCGVSDPDQECLQPVTGEPIHKKPLPYYQKTDKWIKQLQTIVSGDKMKVAILAVDSTVRAKVDER